jgi:RNA polymerase sigma factor (sigma-70 family)
MQESQENSSTPAETSSAGLTKQRALRSPEDIQRDIELKTAICVGMPGWEEAFVELIIDRYGGHIRAAVRDFRLEKYGLQIDDVFEGMYVKLGGGQGWNALWRWDPSLPGAGAFFLRIARNYVLDLMRKEGPEQRSLDDSVTSREGDQIPWADLLPAPGPSIEGRLMFRDALLGCIDRLDREEQGVLRYGIFEGLKSTQVAEIMGLDYQHTRDVKARATRKLRQCLGGGWYLAVEGGRL